MFVSTSQGLAQAVSSRLPIAVAQVPALTQILFNITLKAEIYFGSWQSLREEIISPSSVKLKINDRDRKSPQPVTVLNQMNPVHILFFSRFVFTPSYRLSL
jgi:hypothetical protein